MRVLLKNGIKFTLRTGFDKTCTLHKPLQWSQNL
jgi:hypothetical protein